VTPAYDAEIVTGDGSETVDVSIEKVSCAAPGAIVTETGTLATAILLLDSEILARRPVPRPPA
jgi:hypothetical protein